MSLRALHIVNEPSGPGGVFLPPLRRHGFSIDSVDSAQHELPETLAGYDAVISCGGTANTHESDKYPWIDDEIGLLREALRDGVPVIGLCLGAQLLTKAAGGTVYRSEPSEVGWVEVSMHPAAADDPVLGDVPASFTAMQWHHYACELPPGALELGRNTTCLQAFRAGEAAWGTQFHIEVTRDILHSWARWGAEELEAAGYSQKRFLAEVEEHIERHQAIGSGMGERFAELAARRARSAA
jgi:GMP synthase (glutamine-hydrolysing)